MFKRILLASAFVAALAVGSFGTARSASADHFHPRHGCGYGYGPSYHPRAYAPHPRSAYYRVPRYTVAPVAPAPYRYSAYYATPSYYGAYSTGPSFRLSIGF